MTEFTKEFVLANGRKLRLRPLRNLAPIQHILAGLTRFSDPTSLESMRKAKASDQARLTALYRKLSTYALGWGIIDEQCPGMSKANQVRSWLLNGEEEQNLVDAIMEATAAEHARKQGRDAED